MKQIAMIAAGLLMLFACTKSGSTSPGTITPTTPTSTMNITFNGKTYSLTSTTTLPVTTVIATTTSNPGFKYGDLDSSFYAGYSIGIVAGSSQMSCTFVGEKLSAASAIGTYRCGGYTSSTGYGDLAFGDLTLTDKNDGNKTYTPDYSGKDTTSTITVSVANSTECKGTFSIILCYNGTYFPATGDFDYKH